MNYEIQLVLFTSFLMKKSIQLWWKTEGFPFGTSDYKILGSIEITPLGVVDSSKLVEELGSKESATLSVCDWENKGIPEGAIIGTDLGNYE